MNTTYDRATVSRLLGVCAIVIAIAASLGIVGLTFGANSASAEGVPTVTAEPGEGLIDGQVLTVSWKNFTPDAGVVIRQCAGSPTSSSQCSTLLQTEPNDPAGAGSATFAVVATNGSDRQLFGAPSVRCNDTSPCTLAVLPDSAPNSIDQAALAPLKFAKPNTGCPTPGARAFAAEGTDAASRAITAWQPLLCEEPDLTSVDYVAKNDPSGKQDFLCGLRDVAIAQNGWDADATCNGSGASRAAPKVAPISASALGFAYNLRDQKSGKRILDLKLSPSLLAQIFTGQILRWNDPRITALNPDHNLPTKMRVVGRADGSELNRQLTTFFWDTARDSYLAGGSAFADGPTDTYPSITGVDLRTGGPAVATALAFPSDNDPRDDPSYGYIGVLDTSVAALWGLPSAAIQSTDQSGFVGPSNASIGAALNEMTVAADGSRVADNTPNNPAAYRLPVVSNALLPADKVNADQVEAIKRFVNYAVGKGQAAGTLPLGYAALPANMAQQAVDALSVLKAAPTPTSTTNPTTDDSSGHSADSTSSSTGSSSSQSSSEGSTSGSLGGSSSGGSSFGSTDGSSSGSTLPAPPGTAAVAAGSPVEMTSVFAHKGIDRPGHAPFLLPLLVVVAAAGFIVGPRMLRKAGA